MRNSYGYDSYRGRSTARTVLTVLIVVLLLLLLLVVGFFLFAQRYVVYYDDGSVHFEFPWTDRAQPTPSPTPEQPPVVMLTPGPTATPEPTPTPAPLPVLVELPVSSLTGGTAATEVTAAGGNAALFTMKAENGHLAYVSAEGWANYAQVTETDPELNGAIAAALEGEDLYAVARVCCFKDDDTPYYYGRSNGLRDGNGNWRDETGSRWFSPAIPATRSYITNICLELCALGFDEIWLDYCTFPTAGRIDRILRGDAYNDGTLTEDLEGFYAQLHDALAQTYPGVKLSLTASPYALDGTDYNPSGQTVEQLKAYADRIYVSEPAPESDYNALPDTLGFKEDQIIYLPAEITRLPQAVGKVLP